MGGQPVDAVLGGFRAICVTDITQMDTEGAVRGAEILAKELIAEAKPEPIPPGKIARNPATKKADQGDEETETETETVAA